MVRTAFTLLALALLLTPAPDIHAQDPAPPAVDFSGDGVINFSDFILFARGYGKTSQAPDFDARLDLNLDNRIDFSDFILFAQQYGESNNPGNGSDGLPRVYILDLLGDRIEVLNTETNLIDPELTVRLSQPRGLAFSSANGRLYVAGVDTFYALTENHARDYQIPLVDPAQGDGEPTARGGFRVALSPDGGLAYVTEEIAARVEILNLQTRQVIQQIPLASQPVGIAVLPGGAEIYVGLKGRSLAVIDAASRTVTDSIALGGLGNGRIAMAPDGSRIYTARHSETEEVSARLISVNPASRTVGNTLELAQPGDISAQIIDLALSRDGSRLYATVLRVAPAQDTSDISSFTLEGELVTVNTATFQKVDDIRIGDQVGVLGLAPDGNTAYVAGVPSLFEDPSFQIVIVDLESRQVAGSLFGFDLPVYIRGHAGKPVPGFAQLPEIAVF